MFDYQGPTAFKYAVLSADGKRIAIGHVLGNANVVDATYNTSLSAGTDYNLGVTLKAGLVNVSLNGSVVVSKLYNETITQGGYGLISFKGTTSGQTSFDVVEVKTDDATYAPTAVLQVAADSAPAGLVATLTDNELASIVVVAKELWTAALGPDDGRLTALDCIKVQIGYLPPGVLGQTIGDTITVDSSAAGWGWFVDPTPPDNSEFQVLLSNSVFAANPSSPAAGHMDLLSTVVHEMGNAMGFAEDLGDDVAGMTLQAGERRVPEAKQGADLQAAADSGGAVAHPFVLQATLVLPAEATPALPAAATVASPMPAVATSSETAGKTQVSNIVLRPGVKTAQSEGGDAGGDLGKSFVSLSTSLTGGLAASAEPHAEPEAPARHSSRLVDSAKETASINWNNGLDAVEHLASGPANGSREWLDDFLNHVGQDRAQWNPNAGIRVRPMSISVAGHG